MIERLPAEDVRRFLLARRAVSIFGDTIEECLSEEVRYIRSRAASTNGFSRKRRSRAAAVIAKSRRLCKALLEEAGISHTCIRVALGRLIDYDSGEGEPRVGRPSMLKMWAGNFRAVPLTRAGRAAGHAVTRSRRVARRKANVRQETYRVCAASSFFNRDHLSAHPQPQRQAAMGFKMTWGSASTGSGRFDPPSPSRPTSTFSTRPWPAFCLPRKSAR